MPRETFIMPEDLKVGDTFRLTGTAEDPEEAADTRHFTVRELHPQFSGSILTRLGVVVEVDSVLRRLAIGPWVPLIRVEAS